jgi:hypothetical protein
LPLLIPPLLHRRAAAHLRQPLPHVAAPHKRVISEGQSYRSVASSAQHRQEAEVAAAEERKRAVAETAVTAARAAKLAMAELTAARVEVEAAAAAELEALCASSTGSSVSTDDDRDNELKLAREAAREQATQWAAMHPQGRRGDSSDRRGRAGGAPSGGARGGRAPDNGDIPDRRGRAGGWVDGDRGLYRRRDSPSSDRYHGYHGI